jgi:hypothetical protein
MQIIQREVFPFSLPARPVDVLVQHPERAVYALIHHASKLGHHEVLDAAVRGTRAYLEESPGAVASAEALRALVDRMARAVRQTGESFSLDAAVAWENQGEVYLATIGSCAAILARGGAITPLHALDTLARFNPASGMGEAAHWIVLSALAADPADLTAGLVERQVSLRSGEQLALLSPLMAVPVVELGARPAHALGDADALADWLATLPERYASRPLDAVGAALVLSPD